MLGDKTSDLWFFATIQTSRWLTSSKNLHHDSEVNNDTTFAINGWELLLKAQMEDNNQQAIHDHEPKEQSLRKPSRAW